jgi:hypothetical protein
MRGEVVMFYGLERKFFSDSRISLTTPYVVYILVSDTKYRHFVVRGAEYDLKNKGDLQLDLVLKLLTYT